MQQAFIDLDRSIALISYRKLIKRGVRCLKQSEGHQSKRGPVGEQGPLRVSISTLEDVPFFSLLVHSCFPHRKTFLNNNMSFVLIAILTIFTFVYDILTYPIYLIVQQPWKRLNASKRPKEAKVHIFSCYKLITTFLDGFVVHCWWRDNDTASGTGIIPAARELVK